MEKKYYYAILGVVIIGFGVFLSQYKADGTLNFSFFGGLICAIGLYVIAIKWFPKKVNKE
ncbi:hypothetical protein [Joostella sp. CR20]|uniref:hypothetical protein n=1 Tax=Joostella sp. CR20 TaxID=2804312 RepID=UPI00313F08F9